MPTQKTFHHGNLKPALIESAMKILDGEGPDAITIREVARRAGVSHAAPANHFTNRRALLTEVAAILFLELADHISQASPLVTKPSVERVRVFAKALIDYGLTHPSRYQMLWRRDLVDTSDRRLATAMEKIYDALISEISALPETCQLDPDTIAIGLWSIAHGYTTMRLDGNFSPAYDKISHLPRQDSIIDAFLTSLRATA